MIIAIALSFSFVIGSIVNAHDHNFYATIEHTLHPFETEQRQASYIKPDMGAAEILVVGMGRVSSGTYLAMRETRVIKCVALMLILIRLTVIKGQDIR